MSIWSSFCTFGERHPDMTLEDEPYSGFHDQSGHYTTNDPESLASTPRGGMLDIASGGSMCDLFRVYVDGGDGHTASTCLNREQLARLRDGLTRKLAELEQDHHG